MSAKAQATALDPAKSLAITVESLKHLLDFTQCIAARVGMEVEGDVSTYGTDIPPVLYLKEKDTWERDRLRLHVTNDKGTLTVQELQNVVRDFRMECDKRETHTIPNHNTAAAEILKIFAHHRIDSALREEMWASVEEGG